jgi:membrane protein DedA with SNARE-associated domain
MGIVFSWISQYGYAALFFLLTLGIVGLPIPDESLLIFCGYLIWRGQLHPLGAFFAGFGGSICGISLSYTLGRTYGYKFVHRYGHYFGATEARLAKVHKLFERLGAWLLTLGYFILGVRHFTALVAGMTGLEFPKFALFAYFGAALWVTAFLSFGYLVGDKWQQAYQVLHRYLMLATAALAVLVLAIWWIRKKSVKTAPKHIEPRP